MLEIKNVSKTFNPGTVNAKTALNGLNLTLNDGDFVTVIGGNGAGKSTMLNATAGTFFVDSGKVIIDGSDVTNLPEHKRAAFIGRVFQDPMMGTAPSMWIEENLALAARRGQRRGLSWGVTKEEKEQYRELLGGLGLGLESRLTTKVSTLSGGQRQALTLLMATMVPPQLLLLDEHTAALDPATAEKVLDLTRRVVAESHITCLMVTHNMHQALELGTRTLMMDAGRIVLDVSGPERADMTVQGLLDAFAAKAGIDLQTTFEATRGGFAGGPVYENKVPKLIKRDYEPGARVAVHRKDILNAKHFAHHMGVDTPMTDVVLRVMDWMNDNGHIDEDQIAMVKYYEDKMDVTVGGEK